MFGSINMLLNFGFVNEALGCSKTIVGKSRSGSLKQIASYGLECRGASTYVSITVTLHVRTQEMIVHARQSVVSN